MKYRAEIDGLRALAVVPAILFHANFELFSGGFVGVDVFFVISGYLITTILIEDIENEQFSIINFYERRARRILPALFFVMLACIPFAWMWMLPSQMKDFSQSLTPVSLFVSNIFFWQESGYFATAAEEKPLLHTWSLAVEEQYYMFFPIVLLLTWGRFGKNRVFWMIVAFVGISLALSEWGWRNEATANFYLAPTRAWELFAGSIAAFVVQKRGVQANNFLSLLGLVAIVFAIFAYDESTPFPSIYALVPVVGVVLLVIYASKETFAARLLGTKAFVGIGLISYSAYLWHQPLFAFARIRLIEEPSLILMASLSITSLILAVFSWRFIETPFRNKHGSKLSRKSIFVLSASSMLLMITLGYLGSYNDGFAIDTNELVIDLDAPQSHILEQPIYVIGDSHAEHLISGLTRFNDGKMIDMTSNGCIPFRNVDRYDSRFKIGACAEEMNNRLDYLATVNEPSIVVISSMGPVYLDGTPFRGKGAARVTGLGVDLITDLTLEDHYKVYEIGMKQTLSELASNENLTVIFTIDIPELGIDFGCNQTGKEILIFGYKISDFVELSNLPPYLCLIPRHEYEDRARRYKQLVFQVMNDFPSISLFDPTEYFCNQESCFGYLQGYGYLYRNVDHLNPIGSHFYAYNLINEIFFRNHHE